MTLYTDISPYCCAVLQARVDDGSLPPGDVVCADICALVGGKRMRRWLERYDHVHLFAGIGGSPLGLAWAGWPDRRRIVTGGFPCQDISAAGAGAGLDGMRSGLYREMLRAIRLVGPDCVLGENVGALSARGLDRLAREMGEVGYEPHAFRLGAWAVGSPQYRERWWILANRDDERCGPRRRVAGDKAQTQERRHQSGAGGDAGELADVRVSGQGTERIGQAGAESDLAGPGVGVADADRIGRNRGTREQIGREVRPTASSRPSPRRGMDYPAGAGLEGHGADTGQSQKPEPRYAGEPGRWPHPLWLGPDGQPVPTPQHEWEPPRLFPGSRVINARWRLALMGYPLHWLDLPEKVAARFGNARALNRLGVEATGNAQVPQCVKVLAAAWVEAMDREECAT